MLWTVLLIILAVCFIFWQILRVLFRPIFIFIRQKVINILTKIGMSEEGAHALLSVIVIVLIILILFK